MSGYTTFIDQPFGKKVENSDLPVSFPDIEGKTCIHSRYIAEKNDSVESASIATIEKLFSVLNISALDCSAVVLASCTAEPGNPHGTNNTAERIAKMMKISRGVGVDYACSGFPATTNVALSLSKVQPGKHIIIVATEILSRITDWNDSNIAILFGDGSAATSIIDDGPHKIHAAAAHSVKDDWNLLGLIHKKNVMHFSGKRNPKMEQTIRMDGLPLYKDAPVAMVRLVRDALRQLGITPSDSQPFFIAQHQANGKFAGKIQKLIERDPALSHATVLDKIRDRGNIGAASIPSALARAWDEIPPNALIACPSKGAGMAFREGSLTEGIVVFTKAA